MQVLILAAGYTTRLYPLTLDKPKPLLPVAGKPMLEHIIDRSSPVVSFSGSIHVFPFAPGLFRAAGLTLAARKRSKKRTAFSEGNRLRPTANLCL